MNWLAIGLGLFSYLLGSIPIGVLVAKSKGIDIMHTGSGSIGATNVYRTLGRGPGFLVFFLDVLKGLIPALIAGFLFQDLVYAFGIGIVAIFGHSLSPWLGFKGGKGIATGVGALLGSIPIVAVSALSLFIVAAWITRYISVASLVAALSLAPLGLVFGLPISMTVSLAFLGLFVVYRHKANIGRLMAGTEPKFNWKGGSLSHSIQDKKDPDPELQCDVELPENKEEPP